MAKSKDINSMVDKLEQELTALAKSVHADLTKAHPGEETPSEVSPDDSATAPSPEGSAGGPPPEASMGAPAGGAPGGEMPPEGSAGGEGAPGEEGGGAPTHEQIVEALSQLPPEQLEMYKAAIDQVLAQQQGGQPGAGGPPPEASMGAPAGGAPMAMSERDDGSAVIAKAEKAIAEQGVQIRELRKALEDATSEIKNVRAERQEAVQTIENFLKRPDRRAVTTAPAGDLKKSEAESEDISALSKTEVVSRLRKALRTPRTKADYKAVDGFMFHGQPVETVKYLITSANA